MNKLEKILVMLDNRQEEQPALTRAAYLARADERGIAAANVHAEEGRVEYPRYQCAEGPA